MGWHLAFGKVGVVGDGKELMCLASLTLSKENMLEGAWAVASGNNK